MMFEDENIDESMISEGDESLDSANTRKKKRIENLKILSSIPENMPHFLVRVSSTFFKGIKDPKEFFKRKRRSSTFFSFRIFFS